MNIKKQYFHISIESTVCQSKYISVDEIFHSEELV